MDFFSAQDQARKNSFWLVILFVLAVIALIVVTNLFLLLVISLSSGVETLSVPSPEMAGIGYTFLHSFSWERFALVGAGVGGVVFLSSAYRSWSLGKGGKSVAEMLGGTLVNSDSSDPSERRLLNIVEEIAIASGVPVPLVYVMEDEPGINAFAAGLTTGDAVVAVTRGTMDNLNRAELQGVIAHEFSHILNGDMRLNMRLVGVLFGILVIGLIGRFIMRSTLRSGGVRSSRNSGGAVLAFLAAGAGLAILGWVGTIFGNMIKASVSRQREYLADASAVQFTRNPDGIANALKKIGASSYGSIMQHPDAAEFSHAYFEDGIKHYFGSVFATHPPLSERISRIQPSWDGEFIPLPQQREATDDSSSRQDQATKDRARLATYATVLAGGMEAIRRAGQISDQNVAYAAELVRQLPEKVRDAVREPHDSRAIIYALLIDQDRGQAVHQLKLISDKVEKSIIFDQTLSLLHAVHKLERRFRLPLIDMAMPALRQLSPEQYKRFKHNLDILIHADGMVSIFEWALYKIVVCNLDLDFERRYSYSSGRYSNIRQLNKECSVLFSYLARVTPEADPQQALQAASEQLDGMQLELLSPDQRSLDDLDQATQKLAKLKPLAKPQLLKACVACIAADERVTASEMELLRALSALLDCPLPPLPENLPYTN
jgi:Zn-dependent protease with chaperone function